jgi:signal transduction histidine kinase
MLQRQTSILRLFFLFSAFIAFGAAARLFTLRPAQPVPGTLLVPLGCALLPFCHTGVRDFFILRSALTWNVVGLGALAFVVALNQASVGKTGTVIVFTLFLIALAVRGTLHDAPALRSVYEEHVRETAGQEERNRLARDLHDSIKQQIFAIQTGAAAAEVRFDSDPHGARVALADVRTSAREAMTEMEAMLDQLRAAPLESVGLVEALKKQCEALEFRTGARVRLDIAELPVARRWQPGAAQSLFRIAQEALANIARHARATEVKLSLAVAGKDCVLRIEDNGAGFATSGENAQPGMGLSNMRSRATEQGGSLDIRSAQGLGTQLTVMIPLISPGAQNAMRKGWILAGTAIAFASISFVVKGEIFVAMTRGFSTGLFCGAVTQFVHGRRS